MTTNGTRRSAVGATRPWREVTVDGVRLAADDGGVGTPALVCLHAIGHGAGDFAALRRAFAPTQRVVALDWPGHGNSADDSRPPSATRYAALLGGVLDALGIERAILVGNSIGGAAALRYAATHPERVMGLVLENPGGLDRPDRLSRGVIDLMVRFFAAGSRRAVWFPRAFAAYYRTVLQRSAAAAQRARIVASAYEIAPVLRDAWVSFGAPDADLRDLVPTIQCPTLFAWGVRDVAVQLRRSLPAISRFPNVRVERFAAGHAAHLETPDELVAAVRRFVGAQKL